MEARQLVIDDFGSYLSSEQNFAVNKSLTTSKRDTNLILPSFKEDFNRASKDDEAFVLWRKGFLGEAPFFYSQDSRLELDFLSDFPNLEAVKSFNLSFYFNPSDLFRNATLMKASEVVDWQGKLLRTEFSIELKNGRVEVKLNDFFSFARKTISVFLRSNDLIKEKSWNFVSLNYNHQNGYLELKLNDQLVDFGYATTNGEPYGTIYYPIFTKTPFVLGESFLGLIDEVRFYDESVNVEKLIFNDKIYQSVYASRVFRIEPEASISRIGFSGSRLNESEFSFYLCTSRGYFNPEESFEKCRNLPWDRELYFNDFSNYFQFFLVLKNNRRLPKVVKEVRLNYEVAEKILAPTLLNVWVRQSDIVVNWKKSLNPQINAYVIYYSKNEFRRDQQRIVVPLSELEKITTNNDEYAHIIKGLAENERYYFALSALDMKNNTESPLSVIKNIYFNSKLF